MKVLVKVHTIKGILYSERDTFYDLDDFIKEVDGWFGNQIKFFELEIIKEKQKKDKE